MVALDRRELPRRSRARQGSRACSLRCRSSRSSSWSARSPRADEARRGARRRICRSGDGGVYGILQSAGLLFFAFAGYARIATLGEEVRDPARTIPRAIPIALGIAVLIYAVVGVVAAARRRAGCARREHGAGHHGARSGGAAWADPIARVGRGASRASARCWR